MEIPNLFDYATSELSQDAFLAWLIKYADWQYKGDTSGAHNAGRRFIDLAFLRSGHAKVSGDLVVNVERQYYHIDVFAEIVERESGKKYVLVLEDKAGTTEHDNQLDRYWEVVRAKVDDETQMVCVYCQTHNESIKKQTEGNRFCRLIRGDLLGILSESADNLILQSFKDHLLRLETLTNEWRSMPPRDNEGHDKWTWHAWQGFFMKLRERLGEGEWAYVPNPSGGFLGFWWYWRSIEGGSLYLQLEEGKACFKVEVGEGVDAGEKKWTWNMLVLEKACELGVEAIKPPVMRKGAWMTVAILSDDYRRTDRNGCLDLDATLQLLNDMMKVADKVSADWKLQQGR